ncbi:tetratricopeptide repeat protein [Sorangium sp. So ce513]|uniref:tetratricopeptide repeat protein n=1 Tax=Sorangium sp. So ce513 TaxID=3133315 RepID=UPI003F5FF902
MSRRAGRAAATALALALAALLGPACAPARGDAYLAAMAAGQRAYHAGRYREAASSFDGAASRALLVKDRDEARFMQARAFERAEAWAEARASYERLLADSPRGPRSARAEFELADLEIEHGDADAGHAKLLAATKRHPSHGLARNALKRLIQREEDRGGAAGALAWLRQHGPALRGTALDQDVAYHTALLLERSGDREGALRALVAAARAHPYPAGNLTDDALFRAAELAAALGRPEEAIGYLREMLAAREPAATGSYDRARFDDAQLMIARLYRDALGDRAAARRELRKLYTDHPASILRDDALWAEAKLWREEGRTAEACATAALITRELPDSRYARCARAICPSLPEPEEKQRPCADYILRELDGGKDP